jgi:pimeloyl-ACP methyl ester carboxylesterase
MIWLTVLALLGYLGVGTFFYFTQNALLYYPQYTRDHADNPDFSLRRDDGVVLRGWVMNPGHARAVIYFGGNGDAVQAMRQDYARIAPDRTVYLVGYRGYSASDGTPGEQAIFGDALALYDRVQADHQSVAAIGRSLGSGVALYLASQRSLERLVLVTPYDSIARVAQSHFPIFPAGLLMRDRYESWRYAPQVHCPVLVVQAMDDGVIGAPRTAALVAALSPPPTVVRLTGQDHNSVVAAPEYASALTEFLR